MKLADAGCLAFSEGLSRGTMLQTLLLMNQRISVDGIKSIAPTISKLPALQELNFYRNRLGNVFRVTVKLIHGRNRFTLMCAIGLRLYR
jgi:hypothetical protein